MGTDILKSTTLIETTYANIKKDIIENHFKPGVKIVVRELSERYEVSETPIKQALNRLVTEGLVESIPRRGMKVKSITWSEIDDIMEMRLMMDLYFVNSVIETLRGNKELHSEFEANIKENL
jgi:DNA-binding GntR family transcriptional regulator